MNLNKTYLHNKVTQKIPQWCHPQTVTFALELGSQVVHFSVHASYYLSCLSLTQRHSQVSENVGEHGKLLCSITCMWIYGVSSCLVTCRKTSSASECSTHVLINIIVGDASWFSCGVCSLGLVTTDIIVKVEDVYKFRTSTETFVNDFLVRCVLIC